MRSRRHPYFFGVRLRTWMSGLGSILAFCLTGYTIILVDDVRVQMEPKRYLIENLIPTVKQSPLTLVVLAFNRADQLGQLLDDLLTADYIQFRVNLTIIVDGIDKSTTKDNLLRDRLRVVEIATNFSWPHGHKTVAIRRQRANIKGQWLLDWTQVEKSIHELRNLSELGEPVADIIEQPPLNDKTLRSMQTATNNLIKSNKIYPKGRKNKARKQIFGGGGTIKSAINAVEQSVIILESDIRLSRHYFRYAVAAYTYAARREQRRLKQQNTPAQLLVQSNNNNLDTRKTHIRHAIGSITLQNAQFIPDMSATLRDWAEVRKAADIQAPFLYEAIGTWGFIPIPNVWRQYLKWMTTHSYAMGFDPTLPDQIPSNVYIQYQNLVEREPLIHSLWFQYFCHENKYFALYPATPPTQGLAVHNGSVWYETSAEYTSPQALEQTILTEWSPEYASFEINPKAINLYKDSAP